MTIQSITGDVGDLATVEVDRNFTAAYNKETRPLTYHVVYISRRGRVTKMKPFLATAGEKRRKLEKRGIDLDDPNSYAVIAKNPDGKWLKPCGNPELFKHLPKH